eukprot:TRINITY_DN751_c4_g1_i1.p1 TRINITY_DN751_c4_g1~~TRINITY_DN751_c4_g1_i1.p1  ORF type:complete len:937 (+),score=72.93 TRINITY_DN751_c4_g1_i1:79-2811(+)
MPSPTISPMSQLSGVLQLPPATTPPPDRPPAAAVPPRPGSAAVTPPLASAAGSATAAATPPAPPRFKDARRCSGRAVAALVQGHGGHGESVDLDRRSRTEPRRSSALPSEHGVVLHGNPLTRSLRATPPVHHRQSVQGPPSASIVALLSSPPLTMSYSGPSGPTDFGRSAFGSSGASRGHRGVPSSMSVTTHNRSAFSSSSNNLTSGGGSHMSYPSHCSPHVGLDMHVIGRAAVSPMQQATHANPLVPAAAMAVRTPESVALSEQQTTFRWKKGKILGQGAFGTVFIGLNQETGQLMAVKNVRFDPADPKVRDRLKALQREIRVMKQLSHPNIVRYLFTERSGNSVNIFMEYVPGGSLMSLLRQFGRLDEPLVRAYAWQMLAALCYLHDNQVVHRDVKGANVLVAVSGDCKLTDFGSAANLAEISEASFSRTAQLEGTACWMAPEVIRCSGFSYPCDVWSLGCTVMEMLTADAPFSHISNKPLAVMTYVGAPAGPVELPPAAYEENSVECLQFMSECLTRDERLRPLASELQVHPWFSVSRSDSQTSELDVNAVLSQMKQSPTSKHPSLLLRKHGSAPELLLLGKIHGDEGGDLGVLERETTRVTSSPHYMAPNMAHSWTVAGFNAKLSPSVSVSPVSSPHSLAAASPRVEMQINLTQRTSVQSQPLVLPPCAVPDATADTPSNSDSPVEQDGSDDEKGITGPVESPQSSRKSKQSPTSSPRRVLNRASSESDIQGHRGINQTSLAASRQMLLQIQDACLHEALGVVREDGSDSLLNTIDDGFSLLLNKSSACGREGYPQDHLEATLPVDTPAETNQYEKSCRNWRAESLGARAVSPSSDVNLLAQSRVMALLAQQIDSEDTAGQVAVDEVLEAEAQQGCGNGWFKQALTILLIVVLFCCCVALTLIIVL